MVTRIWTDASFTASKSCWGALIQHEGKFHRFNGVFKSNTLKCNQAERLAVVNALHIAVGMGAKVCKVYSDSLHEVRRFNNLIKNSKSDVNIGSKKLKAIKRKLRAIEFHHIPRDKNHYADYLARQAYKMPSFNFRQHN